MPIHIGTSGWSYDHWRGVLYPDGSPASKRLGYYVERFQTVEVNSSFYHWPRDFTFAGWRGKAPDGFVMTIKAPRGLTHAAKVRSPEVWWERIERGLGEQGDRRGPLLAQLPPDTEYLHGGSYSDQDPRWWAGKIREWEGGGLAV